MEPKGSRATILGQTFQLGSLTATPAYQPHIDTSQMPLSKPTPSQTVTFTHSNDYFEGFKLTSNDSAGNTRAWKTQPHYFQTTHISVVALIKMISHAISGGSIEIMGMLTGYYLDHDIYILDCYALPVVGTESRVNPQNDSYEFMLQYLTSIQKGVGKEQNIIGWYHSHPGFGCWLSGIDVQTQKLQQGFEDPYVALVIDPINCLKDGIVDIGAFRTYYDDYKPTEDNEEVEKLSMGYYGKDYYALNVDVFANDKDINMLQKIGAIRKDQSDKTSTDSKVDLGALEMVLKKFKNKSDLFDQKDQRLPSGTIAKKGHQNQEYNTLVTASSFAEGTSTEMKDLNQEAVMMSGEILDEDSSNLKVALNSLNKLARDDLNKLIISKINDQLFD